MIKISNDIRLAHEKLSNASLRFLKFVEKNPGALMRSSFKNEQLPFEERLRNITLYLKSKENDKKQ